MIVLPCVAMVMQLTVALRRSGQTLYVYLDAADCI